MPVCLERKTIASCLLTEHDLNSPSVPFTHCRDAAVVVPGIVDLYSVEVFRRDLNDRIIAIENVVGTPPTAGVWDTVYDFGVYGICSPSKLLQAGLEIIYETGYSRTDAYAVAADCNDDSVGVWCPNECAATLVVPLDFNTTFARVTLGARYVNSTCQGSAFIRKSSGEERVIWVQEADQVGNQATVAFEYEEGDSLLVSESGTCIVDVYSVEAYNENVADRLFQLEAKVSMLQELLLNHSLAINTLSQQCDWETIHVFGSDVDGGICSRAEMAAAGWDMVNTNDDRCQSDHFAAWCGNECAGVVRYALPSAYSALKVVVGSYYGRSCQGFIELVHPGL